MQTVEATSFINDDLRYRMRRAAPIAYQKRQIILDVRPTRPRTTPTIFKDVTETIKLASLKTKKPATQQTLKVATLPAMVEKPARPSFTAFQGLFLKNLGKRSKHGCLGRNWRIVMIWSMATILFVDGVGTVLLQLRTNQQVKGQVNAVTSQTGPTNVDESSPDPSAVANYRVAPDMPRTISIPKLDVLARVKQVSTDANGQIGVPGSIYDTGWYDGSAKPGTPGAMFIDGHVHGPSKPGVFADLKKLVKGDKIQIERGDGKVLSYSVVKLQNYKADQVDMAAALNPAVTGKQGLNLMTCSGKLKGNQYEDRLVVFGIAD